MPPFEILLPVGAIGLYLFDSVQWLYWNELLFLYPAGRWRHAQSSGLLLAGRRPYCPNPLLPGVAQFKVGWSESDTRSDQEQREELARFLQALGPIRVAVNVLLLLLLVLPVELYLFGTGIALLALMAAFYAVILVALGVIFTRRRVLGLTGGAFAAVAFDALACSPFAVNLVRKLCLRRSLAGNPVSFAAEFFDPAEFAALLGTISVRVGEEQLREYGQTPRWLELERYRAELAALQRSAGSRINP